MPKRNSCVMYRVNTMKCAASGKSMLSKRDAVTAKNYREDRGSEPLRIYPCPDCGHWHLTSSV